MSASMIFDHAPLGSLVSWSDGTPRPPERHNKKLASWKTRNSQGWLISKAAATVLTSSTIPAAFTLHECDYGRNGIVVIRVRRTFGVDSALTFKVVEAPAVGSVRIFARPGDRAELVHLAPDQASAEAWLSVHGYPNAVLCPVTNEEGTATIGEAMIAARAA